jgi:hypothetical protein
MGQTTTHTTSAAVEDHGCPAWCDDHHAGHNRTVVHEGTPTARIDTLDADFTARPVLYRGPDYASTELALTIREHDRIDRPGHTMCLGMSIPEAQRLIAALVDVMNLTLPVGGQQFLGPAGFELVRFDGPWA